MIKLHKFIEYLQAKRDTGIDWPDLSVDFDSTWVDPIIELALNSQKFDAGDMGGIPAMQLVCDLIVLPFEKTCVEFQFKRNDRTCSTMIAICERENQSESPSFQATVYELDHHGQVLPVCIGHIRRGDGDNRVRITLDEPDGLVIKSAGAWDGFKHNSSAVLHALCAFFQALSCINVTYMDMQPPQALNKKRRKKGKIPLFEYKVLYVDTGPVIRAVSGGNKTDRKQRLHLRRSHIRQYSPGKYTLVHEHLAGTARGFLDKEYSIK